MKRASAVILMVFGLLTGSGPAWATGANLVSLKKVYPEAKAVSCKTCHRNAVGRRDDLNTYGAALQKLKLPEASKNLAVGDYRAVETEDSDADGLSNAEEIKAGTNPGEPAKQSKQLKGSAERIQAYLDRWVEPSQAWAEERKAEYVGSETCAACHAKEMKEFEHSTHARIQIPQGGSKAQGCEACHGPGSLHVEAGGGRGVGGIVNPGKDPSTCFACHLEKKAEFRMAFHHPVLEGKMSCADCHSPHGQDVRPWSATSLEGINEVCFKCHKDQRGPFVWEHEALREGCTTCHKVHGSVNDKMLVARDNNLCLRCHTQVNFPTIGKQNHASRASQGSCFSAGCHTAAHGSNFDEHLRY